MYKVVSDVFNSATGKPYVEWEFEDGSLFREEFKSEKERDRAIQNNEDVLLADMKYDELLTLYGY